MLYLTYQPLLEQQIVFGFHLLCSWCIKYCHSLQGHAKVSFIRTAFILLLVKYALSC